MGPVDAQCGEADEEHYRRSPVGEDEHDGEREDQAEDEWVDRYEVDDGAEHERDDEQRERGCDAIATPPRMDAKQCVAHAIASELLAFVQMRASKQESHPNPGSHAGWSTFHGVACEGMGLPVDRLALRRAGGVSDPTPV